MIGEHRKKHRLNLVDIFLILVIILSIVGIALRSNLEDHYVKQTTQLEATCRIIGDAIEDPSTFFRKETPIYLSNGTLFGICKAVDTDTITIKCTAEIGDGVYLVEGAKISCNRTLTLHTSFLAFEAIVLDITENH